MARHQFLKGNKYGRGGKKGNKGGRPTKLEAQLKKLAADLAKKYIEDRLRPILDAYISLASGQRSGNSRRKLDPATCRHAVERFIGPAPRSLVLDFQESIETFYEEIQAMEEGKTAEEGKS